MRNKDAKSIAEELRRGIRADGTKMETYLPDTRHPGFVRVILDLHTHVRIPGIIIGMHDEERYIECRPTKDCLSPGVQIIMPHNVPCPWAAITLAGQATEFYVVVASINITGSGPALSAIHRWP